jgi:NADPH-dependent 7-cyano-7-deazaguanine reductase QueF-like protein
LKYQIKIKRNVGLPLAVVYDIKLDYRSTFLTISKNLDIFHISSSFLSYILYDFSNQKSLFSNDLNQVER